MTKITHLDFTKEQKTAMEYMIQGSRIEDVFLYVCSLLPNPNTPEALAHLESLLPYFRKKIGSAGMQQFHDIFGTAQLLYTQFGEAAKHFESSSNVRGLAQTLHLAKLYGRYSDVKAIQQMSLPSTMQFNLQQYESFLIDQFLPHIRLEREEDRFYLPEEELVEALDLFDDQKQQVVQGAVDRMIEAGNTDLPRQLLLALYSSHPKASELQQQFQTRIGKRKTIDDTVLSLCDKNTWDFVDSLQQGDLDDFYPLSAHIYLVQDKDKKIVLKEHIRYTIDFSNLHGHNIEKELYSGTLLSAVPGGCVFPRYGGSIEHQGIEFLQLEFVPGQTLTSFTAPPMLLPLEESLGIVEKIAKTFAYFHDHALIYADLKDKNLLYDKRKLTLFDFGMSSDKVQVDSEGNVFIYSVLSNAEYASPETMMLGRCYKQSDIFQLGILLYKLVTGSHPFTEGIATTEYQDKSSELLTFSLANLWRQPDFTHPKLAGQSMVVDLLEGMLDKDYRKRPSAQQVYEQLQCNREEAA